jgi:hypothetical protein|tara:strand:+ start:341 stop:988 length:648 start_codon:yes stop_codon:yes gene_type:complete
MVAFIFKKLLEQGGPSGKNVDAAVDWFQERSSITPTRPLQIVRGTDSEAHTPQRFKKRLRRGRYEWGRMVMFQYDPVAKATLPYYDKFPMGFIVDVTPDGFLMLNMHYLPPILRANVMDALYQFLPLQEGQQLQDSDKLEMMPQPYRILKRYRRLRWYKGCLKRYLNTNIQSRIVTIYPKEWNMALFMPMTRTFRGASKQQVWKDTRIKGRGVGK